MSSEELNGRELNAKLLAAIEATRERTNRPRLTALIGNDIKICDWTPGKGYGGRVLHLYKAFSYRDIELAIAYVEQMKPLGYHF